MTKLLNPMHMKTRNINLLMLFTAVLIGFLSSSKKDDVDIPAGVKPQTSALELGSGNINPAKSWSDLHLKA